MSNAPTKLQACPDVVDDLASRQFPVSTEDLWSNASAQVAGLDGSKHEKQRVSRRVIGSSDLEPDPPISPTTAQGSSDPRAAQSRR